MKALSRKDTFMMTFRILGELIYEAEQKTE